MKKGTCNQGNNTIDSILEETFKEGVVHCEALFFAIAGTEIIMSLGLGYWTSY